MRSLAFNVSKSCSCAKPMKFHLLNLGILSTGPNRDKIRFSCFSRNKRDSGGNTHIKFLVYVNIYEEHMKEIDISTSVAQS